MVLKDAERLLWTKQYFDMAPKIKYREDDYKTLEARIDTCADSYYTKSHIDTIIQNILDEQDKLKEKRAAHYIEENIDILDASVDDFLDRCPTDFVDVVIRILKNADVITDEDTKRYLGRNAYSKLCKLSSQSGLRVYPQYDLNPPTTITLDTLDPDWWENAKADKGTWE